MEYYSLIKHIHVTAAGVSFLGFLLRGYWMLTNNGLLKAKLTKVLPHIIDTFLLAAAICLVIITQHHPFQVSWITAKILLLIVYIVTGTIALKRGKTKKMRVRFFVLSSVIIIVIFAIAITKPGLNF